MRSQTLFGCEIQRGCHTVSSVWCVNIWLDARDGEGGNAGAGLGIDWTLHTHEIAHAKSGRGQTLARRGGIGNTERGKVQAGAAGQRRIEFAGQRRV